MKIAVATSGRFHVLDLARELDALGHEVTFYSCLPPRRAEMFGLPARCHVSLLPLMAPLLVARRVAPKAGFLSRWETTLLDACVASMLRPCDVFIGMSGLFLKSLRVAKSKYAAKVILQRGSRHILSQDEILRLTPVAQQIDVFDIRREVEGYDTANFISVPSRHVADSFLERGIPERKLLVTPYGCDLKMFPPTARSGSAQKTILFVGLWSLQKGCDILLEAWRRLKGVRLMHVGPVGDLGLPSDSEFVHVNTVSQEQLSRFYAQADVFVLASRQDGFGMVLSQALASGLPVVCTSMTGGADLRAILRGPDAIFEVAPADSAGLCEAIQRAFASIQPPDGKPRIVVDNLEDLSWQRYGQQYEGRLRRLIVS